MTGFLRPFSGPARTLLIGLLQGRSLLQACVTARITDTTARLWQREDPEFRQAVEFAQQLGFASTIESELYHVALDRSHRGQIRALEIIAKARRPEYREKAQVQMTVIHQAEEASSNVIDGWQSDDTASSASN